MYITKDEIGKINNAFLHDALYSISRVLPSFKTCYMDPNGELALTFDSVLSIDDIRGVLFALHPFSPYDAAPEGPSGEDVSEYDYIHTDCGTRVYSRDGIDYRKCHPYD